MTNLCADDRIRKALASRPTMVSVCIGYLVGVFSDYINIPTLLLKLEILLVVLFANNKLDINMNYAAGKDNST